MYKINIGQTTNFLELILEDTRQVKNKYGATDSNVLNKAIIINYWLVLLLNNNISQFLPQFLILKMIYHFYIFQRI